MKTAYQAHLETQKFQKKIPEGTQLAEEYMVEPRIESAIKEGKYDIVITVSAEDCPPIAEYLRSLGYYVAWSAANHVSNRSMTIGWNPNDTAEWDGP